MKRSLRSFLVFAAFTAPVTAGAQTTITFDGAPNGTRTVVTDGYTVGGLGEVLNGTFKVYGDGYMSQAYLYSDSPFALRSLDLRSYLPEIDNITISGYSSSTVDRLGTLGGPLGVNLSSGVLPRDYFFEGFISMSAFETFAFDWSDLAAVSFTDRGGRAPHDIDPSGATTHNYLVDNIVVDATIVTPEPATMLLLGTGLLGLVAVRSRRA